MARPRNICFYEKELPNPLPESQLWLADYHKNSQTLVNYMTEKGAGSTAYYATIRCLAQLREYLIRKDLPYSPTVALQWYAETGPYPQCYQAVLLRISDLFSFGEIQLINAFPRVVPYRQNLNEPWRSMLDEFLDTFDYTSSYLVQIKNVVSRFLYWIQQKGLSSPSDIDFELLEEYCQTDCHRSASSKARYTYGVGDILLYMADNGMCIHGLGWYPYFRMHGRVFRLCDFPEKQKKAVEDVRQESLEFPAEEYAVLIPDFLDRFKSAGYSEASYTTARYVLYNVLLFLEMHGLGYHQKIADAWLAHEMSFHGRNTWIHASRIIYLFGLYIQEGDLMPSSINRCRPLLCESLPAWCRDVLGEYMAVKQKEGWKRSTLDMIRSSVTRFCSFLSGSGLGSFSELSAECLKEFNLRDKHLTAEGKNAYNIRIRKFVMYLERRGTVPYGIHNALSCTSAPREKIVVTLTKDEKAAIKQMHSESRSSLELRDRAIILLGTRMGLRSSDIVTILLKDIDWDRQTIRIVQEKTAHEVLLPMPTEVGNAIYTYLVKGRPNDRTTSPYLFIKERVPYDSLCRKACGDALRRALPERAVPGSGFHVTRKTYATDRLRSGTSKQGLADLLGQKDTQSLRHYLQLDEECMRMCPLSLAEAGLMMKGGRYDGV